MTPRQLIMVQAGHWRGVTVSACQAFKLRSHKTLIRGVRASAGGIY